MTAQPPSQVRLPCFDDVCTTKFDVVVVPVTYTGCAATCNGWAVFYVRTACGFCEVVLQEVVIASATDCPCQEWQLISDAFRAGMEAGALPPGCIPPKDDCITTLRLGLGTCYEKFDSNVHDPFGTPLPGGRKWVRCEEEPCCSGEYKLCRDNEDNFTVTRTGDPGTPVTSSNCDDFPQPPSTPLAGLCYNYCFALPASFAGKFTSAPKSVIDAADDAEVRRILIDGTLSEGARLVSSSSVSGAARVVVTSMHGKEVFQGVLTVSGAFSGDGILIEGSKSWASGVYAYSIFMDGVVIQTGKFVMP